MKLELKDGEETIDVCKAWEDMKKEAARKAAEERTLLQDLRNMMEALHLSAEQAMTILKVPKTKQSRLSAKL